MTLPKEIFAFVLIEYIQTQDFHPSHLGATKIIYSNGNTDVTFERSQFSIPLIEVDQMLNEAGLDFEHFKHYCEYFLESADFEIAMRQSIIKPKS